MMADTDTDYLMKRELDNKICLNIVTMFALIFTASFVIVTTLAFLNIQDLDAKDVALRLQIQKLQRKLQTYKESRGEIAKGAEELIQEITDAAIGGAAEEVDSYEDEYSKRRDTTRDDGENNRERRQQINIFDAILAAQRVVFEKHCVSHNTSCPKGPRGANGTAGDPGLNGTNGSPGTKGTKGLPGDVAGPGLRGDVGSKGLEGDPGINGRPGLVGDTGAWGENGLQGDRGSAGLKGTEGEIGLNGTIGDTGPMGENGTRGINGTKGDVGEPGVQGVNGTQGNTGPKGQDVPSLANGCECFKKPSFKNPNDQTIVVGSADQKQIPCTGEGNPAPTVTLTKLPQKQGRKRAITHVGNVYTLNRPIDTDYGRYACTATNVYGTATKVVTVAKPSSG